MHKIFNLCLKIQGILMPTWKTKIQFFDYCSNDDISNFLLKIEFNHKQYLCVSSSQIIFPNWISVSPNQITFPNWIEFSIENLFHVLGCNCWLSVIANQKSFQCFRLQLLWPTKCLSVNWTRQRSTTRQSIFSPEV
jgi:hypothetical protein